MKQVNIIERTEIKGNGVILYEVLSSNGVDKHYVTIKGNEVFCTCDGWNGKYHKCYHTTQLMAIEGEIAAEKKMAAHDVKMTEQYASDPRPMGLAETYLAGWYPKSDRY